MGFGWIIFFPLKIMKNSLKEVVEFKYKTMSYKYI